MTLKHSLAFINMTYALLHGTMTLDDRHSDIAVNLKTFACDKFLQISRSLKNAKIGCYSL